MFQKGFNGRGVVYMGSKNCCLIETVYLPDGHMEDILGDVRYLLFADCKEWNAWYGTPHRHTRLFSELPGTWAYPGGL